MRNAILSVTLMSSLAVAACTATTAEPSGQGGGGKADGTECPVDGGVDAIEAAITGAGSCVNAADIAEACAYGSNIDRSFVDAAAALCTQGFTAMSESTTATYEQLLERCSDKYADLDGSMYRSFTAYCQLEVMRLYNHVYPDLEVTEALVEVEHGCPVRGDAGAIESAIFDASSCAIAANMAEDCARGGEDDISFAAAASERCIAGIEEIPEADAALLATLNGECEALTDNEAGPLRNLRRAYCSLQIDVVYNVLTEALE